MNPIIVIAIIIIWLYILSVTKRAKLHAWSFMWGSLGLYVNLLCPVQGCAIFFSTVLESVTILLCCGECFFMIQASDLTSDVTG